MIKQNAISLFLSAIFALGVVSQGGITARAINQADGAKSALRMNESPSMASVAVSLDKGSIVIMDDGSAIQVTQEGQQARSAIDPKTTQIEITSSAPTKNTVIVRTTPAVYIKIVGLHMTGDGDKVTPFDIQDTAHANITLEGVNKFAGGTGAAALRVAHDATVILGGEGTLIATGGDGAQSSGAGIGGNANDDSGTIIITDGIVTATGGMANAKNVGAGASSGAGIGGGGNGRGERISTTGGLITATGGRVSSTKEAYAGAGIGGGGHASADKLQLHSGSVLATGGAAKATDVAYTGAGIGGGGGATGKNITIAGTYILSTGGMAAARVDAASGAGIGGGGGATGTTANINITGGTIEAIGGDVAGSVGMESSGAGIGGGGASASDGIVLQSGSITASGGQAAHAGAGIGGGGGANSVGMLQIADAVGLVATSTTAENAMQARTLSANSSAAVMEINFAVPQLAYTPVVVRDARHNAVNTSPAGAPSKNYQSIALVVPAGQPYSVLAKGMLQKIGTNDTDIVFGGLSAGQIAIFRQVQDAQNIAPEEAPIALDLAGGNIAITTTDTGTSTYTQGSGNAQPITTHLPIKITSSTQSTSNTIVVRGNGSVDIQTENVSITANGSAFAVQDTAVVHIQVPENTTNLFGGSTGIYVAKDAALHIQGTGKFLAYATSATASTGAVDGTLHTASGQDILQLQFATVKDATTPLLLLRDSNVQQQLQPELAYQAIAVLVPHGSYGVRVGKYDQIYQQRNGNHAFLSSAAPYHQVTAMLTALAISKQPTKTTYTAGEPFRQDGMSVTLTYADGTSRELEKTAYRIEPSGALKPTDRVVATLDTLSTPLNVTVEKSAVPAGTGGGTGGSTSGGTGGSTSGGTGGGTGGSTSTTETTSTTKDIEAGITSFTDIVGHWGYDAIINAVSSGMMQGTSTTTFAPNASATRAMLWTMFARLKGASLTSSTPWYASAQTWVVAQGLSDGTVADGSITREQLATMLYRFAGSPADAHTLLDDYVDGTHVSSYAQQAMNWAIAGGIIAGTNDKMLQPHATATRAQVATMLVRYSKQIGK